MSVITITPVKGFEKFKVPTPAALSQGKARLRKVILDFLAEYVKHRVRDQNLQKSRAPIAGYSTNPIVIPWKGVLKQIKRPRGGKPMGNRGMFFPGGYAEYRSNVGLGQAFQFYNTGDAWRDWRVLTYGADGTAGQIGWTKQSNAIAASKSEETRPDLFLVDEHELAMVHTKVIEQINTTFFGAPTP